MAQLECHYFSEVLGMTRSMMVILPQPKGCLSNENQLQETYPVLYLLHGASDNHTAWIRNTSIERYAMQYGFVVIMPSADLSFYSDLSLGPHRRYFTHIADELPLICQRFFRLTSDPSLTFVAGLSMGGYGAFKIALRRPDHFCAAASLSGALDIAGFLEKDWNNHPYGASVFGDFEQFLNSDDNLFKLLLKVSQDKISLPHLYAWCGTEDFLYEGNRRFMDWCQQLGIKIHYCEGSGDHQWKYWDQEIQHVLEWFKNFLPKRDGEHSNE